MIGRVAAKTVTEIADGIRNSVDFLADYPVWLVAIWVIAATSTVVATLST